MRYQSLRLMSIFGIKVALKPCSVTLVWLISGLSQARIKNRFPYVRRHRMNRSLKFKVFAYFSSILGLLAISCSLAFGQAISGDLTGTVVDPSGAAVNGATVEAVNTATGQK